MNRIILKIAAGIFIFLVSSCQTEKISNNDEKVVQHVRTKYGAAYTRGGNTPIGPQCPWGSISPGPDTEARALMSDGYDDDLLIKGFSQIHVDAGGPGHYGNFLLSPQTGLEVGSKDHYSDKANEVALCGLYGVDLTRYNIRTEITPTHNAAIYRFIYPESDESSLLIDLSHTIAGDVNKAVGMLLDGELNISEDGKTLNGWGSYRGGWNSEKYTLYFSARLNKQAS